MKNKTLTPPAPNPSPTLPLSGEGVAGSPLIRGAGGVRGRKAEKPKYLPYDKRLTALARQNRHNPTPAESLMWNVVLRGKQFERHKFLRQKPVGDYIVDFYCAELRLVIEIDGDSHADQVDYDDRRTRFLNSLGLHVVRYNNPDVLGNLPGLYDDLLTFIASATHDH